MWKNIEKNTNGMTLTIVKKTRRVIIESNQFPTTSKKMHNNIQIIDHMASHVILNYQTL